MSARRKRLGSNLRKVDAHVIQPHEYDEAPELDDDFFDRAEIRRGDTIIRQGRPPLDYSAAEDAADLRTIRESRAAIAAGRDVLLPSNIAERIIFGENAVRVVREWREMSQGALAAAVGISRSHLSAVEAGRRNGSANLYMKLARKLGVPIDLLVDE